MIKAWSEGTFDPRKTEFRKMSLQEDLFTHETYKSSDELDIKCLNVNIELDRSVGFRPGW